MTRKEAIRQTRQSDVLVSLGFTRDEAESLRRISLTLHRWSEHECNGAIQRDGDDGDGQPFWYNTFTGRKSHRVPDRERGALRRLKTIVDRVNLHVRHGVMPDGSGDPNRIGALSYYVQGDPRGCSLYILRPGDVPEGQRADGYYSRGIAVY